MSNNLADISTSSLSVFNATFKVVDKKRAKENKYAVEKWQQNFIDDEQFLIKTKDDYKKKKAAFERLEKSGQTTGQEYVKAGNGLGVLRVRRITCRSNLKHVIKELAGWGIVVTSTELDNDD